MDTLETARALLNAYIGYSLHTIGYAEDMVIFEFRDRRTTAAGFTIKMLHGRFSWRFEAEAGVLTGTYDWHRYALGEELWPEDWKPIEGGSLLDARLRELLQDIDPGSNRAVRNNAQGFDVVEVNVSALGDCMVRFQNGIVLKILPCGSRGEAWVAFNRGESDKGFSMCMEDIAASARGS